CRAARVQHLHHRQRRRGDRMNQSHSTRHRPASSVPRWLTICLQWLLFQQMHYHGSESPGMALRGIEPFLNTRATPVRMINSYLGMVFGRPADQTTQRISLTVFQERKGSFVGLVVSHPIRAVQSPDLCRKKLIQEYTVPSIA